MNASLNEPFSNNEYQFVQKKKQNDKDSFTNWRLNLTTQVRKLEQTEKKQNL
jgi:hypothetical protein